MLAWFALIPPLMGEPWWFVPNLFASAICGERSVLAGPGLPTWAGSAVQLVSAGLVGALNGVLTPGGRLFGLGVAAAWYLACYFLLWKRLSPAVLWYGPQPVLIAGYFLYGSVLGWHQAMVNRTRE